MNKITPGFILLTILVARALAAPASKASVPTMRSLASGDDDINVLIANIGAVDDNLRDLLNVSGDSDSDTESGKAQNVGRPTAVSKALSVQGQLADKLIAKGEKALARKNLPQSPAPVSLRGAYVGFIEESSDADVDLAAARSHMLSAQFSLLHLRMWSGASEKDKAAVADELAKARRELKMLSAKKVRKSSK